ncbi:LVIVD repeat-containing protein [Solirubrobacter pauli]|uniref:LVIVD repeat-containing protein n=1 Tax=Solirubrobacter pauli TaxID=166793 RepID=A0A660L8V3_9ACTN|nr:hypothetical protein [Solirubrobacter pauli]RKQ90949.1 LVIVD repeat-containing protein [Solirubrobacter pauli]
MGTKVRGAVAAAGALVAVALCAPGSATAHPCASANAKAAANNSFLSLNNTSWVGIHRPELDHECGGEGGAVTSTLAKARAAGVTIADDPTLEQVAAEFERSSNMTPVGFSANVIPYLPNPYNSDLAFQGDYAYMGTNDGFVVIDIKDPAKPKQVHLNKSCTTSQGDVVVYGNILVRSWDSATNANGAATQSCGGTLVGLGFEGIHIFDITDPANPVMVDVGNNPADGKQGLRFSVNDVPRKGCGSHTATAVPSPANDALYIYNGGSNSNCTWMDVLKIKISDPTQAAYVKQAPAGRQCHDNTVFLNGAESRATCAGGNGITMFKFDATIDPTLPGGIENPVQLWSKQMAGLTGGGHSAAFSYDGKTVVWGHEPGGGVAPNCQTNSDIRFKSLYILNVETGDQISTVPMTRAQDSTENCTWHNFNTVPTKGGNYLVSGNYQAGINVVDFTQPAAPKIIAYADPKPLPKTTTYGGDGYPDGGDWSTYWYNGKIYEADIYRGLVVWDLDNPFTDRANTVSYSNPQTQIGAITADNVAPTATSTQTGPIVLGSTVAPAFTCADEGLGVESCTANVTSLDTSSIGPKSYTVTAVDKAGNEAVTTIAYVVNATAATGTPGGTVPATLALTLGTPASFGAFTPGVDGEYTATTDATVISTAGDAALAVADTGANAGHLVNGAFVLPQPLQGLGVVKTWSGPTSNEKVTVTFKQAVSKTDALRTGSYGKTLTFTLSTTNP